MKIRRITIEVELPWEGTEPLADDLLKVTNECLCFWTEPNQAQAWSELSPNTRIGGMKRDDEDERCEKCGEPMNEHDRWNRCPVNCAECGIALKAHGAPGSGCPSMGVAGMEVAPMNCDKCGLEMKVHGAPGTPCPVRMQNYLAQARLAEAQMTVIHNKLLAEGYVETAPGILTSPDGKVVVEW